MTKIDDVTSDDDSKKAAIKSLIKHLGLDPSDIEDHELEEENDPEMGY